MGETKSNVLIIETNTLKVFSDVDNSCNHDFRLIAREVRKIVGATEEIVHCVKCDALFVATTPYKPF